MRAAVVVLGATGVIGRGVVQAALDAAWPMIAVAQDPKELQQLAASHAGASLTVLPGSVADEADSAALAAALHAMARPLAGVIVAVSGGTGRGRLLDHPTDVLRHQLDEDLLPHLAAARHLLPLLAQPNRGGSYVLIGGPGSDLPWAGYGHRSVAAAALRMLACVLHDEARALAVRVQLLSVDRPTSPDLPPAKVCPQWPTAIDIGRRALALIDGRHDEAARAVVRYAAGANRRGDVDPARAGSTLVGHPRSTGRADPESNRATRDADDGTSTAQDPDNRASALPATCLMDARALLRAFLLQKPNQESSPR